MSQAELNISTSKRFNINHRDEKYSDVWLTPKWLIDSLGSFDLDPCSAMEMPWETASTMWTKEDDGLSMDWFGRVWCNPPYSDIVPWFERMAYHNNGIMLVFARTETSYFHKYVWPKASGIFFFEGRLSFCKKSGIEAKNNAGAPSVLISYGNEDADILDACKFRGRFIDLRFNTN